MSRHLVVLAALLAAACGTFGDPPATGPEYTEAPKFLREEIVQRIDAVEYQSGQELVRNLNRLVYIGEPAIPFLLDGLEHESARTRGSCAWVLGMLRDRRTMDALAERFNDEAHFVRYEAAAALCSMGDPRGYPVLIAGLSDPDIRNRYKAHEALRLLTSLDFGYRHDDDPNARQTATLRWEQWLSRMESRPG